MRRILPTLAALLACQSPEFAEILVTELEKDQRLGHKPVTEQIGPLLRRPLAALASSARPTIFVIDALDECSNERELAELLQLLAGFKCDAKVKFILTSRPEMHIRGTPISSPNHNTILQLHTIVAGEVTSDIRLYVTGTLDNATREVATWYTNDDIELIVKMSGGLFIFASTVLKYILDPEDVEDCRDRLRKVTSAVAKGIAATNTVDKVYELIITEASRSEAVDSDELQRMRCILACILTARSSLSVEALSALIDIRPARLRSSLRRLHSIVHVPSDDFEPRLQTLHASFGDYMLERGPDSIRIAPSLVHDILARGCLRRLGWDDLCFNISRSQSSFQPNPDTEPNWIPLSLIYACLNWAHHVDAASITSDFGQEIAQSFRPKFLFWLEVLSVLGKIGLASGLLRIAGSAVSPQRFAQTRHLYPIRLDSKRPLSFFATLTSLPRLHMLLSVGAHLISTSRRSRLRRRTL